MKEGNGRQLSSQILMQTEAARQQLEFLNSRWQSELELFDLVAYLYEVGFTVIPLQPRSKTPTFEWKDFRLRRPSWTEVAKLFEEAVQTYGININIGAITGSAHNYVVIDADRKEALEALLEAYPLKYFTIHVWIVKTGRGAHFYAKYPEGGRLPYIAKPKDKSVQGIELLGEGHIVVLPPSIHPSGRLYQWHAEYNPVTKQVYELPPTVINFFDTSQSGSEGKDAVETFFDAEADENLAVITEGVPEWLKTVGELLKPYWTEGNRHNLSLAVIGLLWKWHIPMPLAKVWLEQLMFEVGDDEPQDRLRVLEDTYKKPPKEVAGYRLLKEIVGREVADAVMALFPLTEQKRRLAFTVDFKLTDAGNADLVVSYFGDKIIYTPERGFYVFDGKRFIHDIDNSEVERLIELAFKMEQERIANSDLPAAEKERRLKWLEQSANDRRISACRNRLKHRVKVSLSALDADAYLLNLQNGVLDLRTFELYPHSPEFLLTQIANASYNPDADCPKFKEFLQKVLRGDEELMEMVQRIAGYTLLGHADEEVVIYLYGIGANGKSTFLKILKGVLGDYAKVVSRYILLPLTRRPNNHPEEIADLHKVRMAIIEELPEDAPISASAVKSLASITEITARELFKPRFTFSPTFKLYIAANEPPEVVGRITEGLFRRILPIPFLYEIPREEQKKGYYKEILAEERDGILNWMLEGLKRYYEVGLKVTSQVILNHVEMLRTDLDIVNEWIKRFCDTSDKNALTPFRELYEHFKAFVKSGDEKASVLSEKAFGTLLTTKGYVLKRTGNRRYRLGIKLRPDAWQLLEGSKVDTQQALGGLMSDTDAEGETETDTDDEPLIL